MHLYVPLSVMSPVVVTGSLRVVTSKRKAGCFVFPPQIRLEREGGPLFGVLEALELQVRSPDGLCFGGGLWVCQPASDVLP